MTKITFRFFLIVLVSLSFGLSGCGIFNAPTDKMDIPPQTLIDKGMKQLKKKRYEGAIETFQTLRDHHPYSRFAILAELKQADAYYLNKDYDQALEHFAEFERLHPKNEAVPYVIYQQGMSSWKQVKTLDRDQSVTVLAVQTFNRLKQGYPDSKYAGMAADKIAEGRSMLAAHELYIGEFYLEKKKYKAALGRFLNLVNLYPETASSALAKPLIEKVQSRVDMQQKKDEENSEKNKTEKKATKPKSRLVETD